MAIGKQQRDTYKPYFPPALPDPNYPKGQTRILVDTSNFQEHALQILSANYVVASLDTETTGLDTERDSIVGISLATSLTQSYYFPVGHRIGDNLPLDPVLELCDRVNTKVKRLFFYNSRFDLRVLRRAGIEKFCKIEAIKAFDVAVLVYNADTNIKMPKLKWAEQHYLGWPTKTYSETAGDNPDLSYNDPKDVYQYACDDVLGPMHLAYKLNHIYKGHEFICDLDNKLNLPIMYMEDSPTIIDRNLLAQMSEQVTANLAELEVEVYNQVGYQFTINSPQQLVRALEHLGLKTLKTTAKGSSSTKEDALDEIADQHPVIKKIIEYKILLKLKGSYVDTLYDSYREDLRGVRFSYLTNAVPTGRLAAGSDKKNSFFAHINVQSIPKASPAYYSMEESNEPGNILGYKFTFVSEDKAVAKAAGAKTESASPRNNVRNAFIAPEGYYFAHADYSQQELKIPANLSGEPVWVSAFTNGEDLHKKMTIKIYGEENYDGEKRRKIKTVNFGALFGGNEWTFARQLKIPLPEAKDLVTAWWSTIGVLKSWCKYVQREAKKTGVTSTFFGRPRRLKHWFASPSRKDIGYGERSVVSHKVQGSAADIMRIDLVRLFGELRIYLDAKDLYIVSTVHDEINFYIRKEKFNEIMQAINNIMTIKISSWTIPLTVGISVGYSWGSLFDFVLDKEQQKWIPEA